MELPEHIDVSPWPEVPEEFRPKKLPYEKNYFDKDAIKELKKRGYEPVDVTFLDGAEGIRMRLEGALLGTVELTEDGRKTLELAARVYGVQLKNADEETTKGKLIVGDIEEQIKALSNRSPTRRWDSKLPEVSKKNEKKDGI